jgi:hypothetical protein
MNDIQRFFGYSLVFILVLGLHIFFVRLTWSAVRSLLGKPVNLPPSNIRWFRTRATVVQDEETRRYQALYYFEDEEYTAYINGFTVYGDKAMIYVKRSAPRIVKEYIPQPPMGTEAAVASLFIAGIILFFDLMILF